MLHLIPLLLLAGQPLGPSEEWIGEQKISAPLAADADARRERVKSVDALIKARYGSPGLRGTRADLAFLQRILDDGAVRKDDTFRLQSLGMALGEVLVNELGFHWVVVEDKYGRDPAVKFASTSVLVFPMTMISKRVERAERPDVLQLFEAIRQSLPDLARKADRKPGS